ncbi:MAG: glycosyltransferase family 39 protein [Acidobacteria bacterium]|nr:glycosyltransferase family 39 protein [Acidobacteriota bacterium]
MQLLQLVPVGGAGGETVAAPGLQRWRRRCGMAAVALAALVVGLWLVDVLRSGEGGGRAVPEALSRAAILAALAAAAGWLIAAVAARLSGLRGRALAAALVLPALLALSLAVRFAGIDSEVTGRYYLDEGTYYHHATRIDQGEVLRLSFVYPHFTYYADALVLWAAARFPAMVAAAARRLYGLEDPLAVAWLLLRGVVALLSALTVVPVYKLAARLAGGGAAWTGRAAGALAAALLVFSDLYNEGSHLNTCDVPSAFFATLCLLFVARLVDGERAGDYLLAGAAAGLAGVSKYPAALVALAIAAVWAGWRVRRRDWNAGLIWAALAAAGTVVAVMPSLVVYPDFAFSGPKGILYGAHQYGQGGWLGVMPESNAGFYADKLLWSFGWPAVAAGLSGLALLAWRRRGRGRGLARLLWLAPFPVLFLTLIVSMNMVVKRNLYPVVPILAVYLGVGMAAWLELAAEIAGRAAPQAPPAAGPGGPPGPPDATSPPGPAGRRLRARAVAWRWAPAVLAVACLWPPAELTARQTVGYVTPSTREEAGAWIRDHLPAGASIVKESYTPDFPAGRFAVSHERFAGRIAIADLRSPQNDYLLLSSAAYSRFADPESLFTDNQRLLAGRYQEIFRTFPLVKEWVPDELQLGPVLRLYRVDPDPAACQPVAQLPAADAFVSDAAMRADPERPLQYRAAGEWSLFRGCLPAGRYRLALAGQVLPPALVRITDAQGGRLDLVQVQPAAGIVGGTAGTARESAAEIALGRRGKVLFYVYLAPGSRLRAVSVTPVGGK